MLKLKTLIRRHVLWVGMVAVTIPLLIILALQYRSLSELERTLPIANQAWMRKYLATVAGHIEDRYRADADRALTIAPGTIDKWQILEQLPLVAEHFERNPVDGARRYFVGFTGKTPEMEYSKVVFYSPNSKTKFESVYGSPEWRAAHRASADLLYHSFVNMPLEATTVSVDERDPENRIITKPVLDKKWGVACVLGMILDESYLKEEVLPRMVEESLPRFFPSDYRDVIVTLRDGKGELAFANQPVSGQSYEAGEPLHFVFKDWHMKILMRNMTEEQGAKRLFVINLSLSALMMGLVVGGIIMALRTASREMRLSQMKSDFVSNVSHELRTPLASIRVFGEFFKLGWVKEREKVREYGEFIENESRRLTQLINNILDFSKIESGSKTYQFERADVKEVVAETLKAFEVRLSQSGFNVVTIAPPEPLVAAINRDAITQSVMNLLDNAVKYSGEDKEITVWLDRKDKYITIAVADHGIGIPVQEQEKIFEKFYRVSTGLVHDVRGSGLGLSIIKHIVDAHSGKITVESQQGAGSTFTIFLPADEGYVTGDAHPPRAEESPAPVGLRVEDYSLGGDR
jgi:signal transduction histidine kinase